MSATFITGASLALSGTAEAANCPVPNSFNRVTSNFAPSTGNWYTNEVIAPANGSNCIDEVLWVVGHTNSYKGQYLNGAVWTDSTVGWIFKFAGVAGDTAIVTNIVDGTHVRATEFQSGNTAVTIHA